MRAQVAAAPPPAGGPAARLHRPSPPADHVAAAAVAPPARRSSAARRLLEERRATGSSSTGGPGSLTPRASWSRSRSRGSPSTEAGPTECGRTCRASPPTTWRRSPCCTARASTFTSAWTGRRWRGWRGSAWWCGGRRRPSSTTTASSFASTVTGRSSGTGRCCSSPTASPAPVETGSRPGGARSRPPPGAGPCPPLGPGESPAPGRQPLIRAAVDSDLDAIVRVHNRARPLLADTVAALRARRAAGVALRDDVPWIRLVAELDGEIVGTGRAIEASSGPVPEPGVVYAGIEVDPDVAGRGIGHAALRTGSGLGPGAGRRPAPLPRRPRGRAVGGHHHGAGASPRPRPRRRRAGTTCST